MAFREVKYTTHIICSKSDNLGLKIRWNLEIWVTTTSVDFTSQEWSTKDTAATAIDIVITIVTTTTARQRSPLFALLPFSLSLFNFLFIYFFVILSRCRILVEMSDQSSLNHMLACKGEEHLIEEINVYVYLFLQWKAGPVSFE